MWAKSGLGARVLDWLISPPNPYGCLTTTELTWTYKVCRDEPRQGDGEGDGDNEGWGQGR